MSIHNFGRIETSGLGAAAIFVQGKNAHIANYGSVVTHGDFFDPDATVDGDEFFSEGIFAFGDGYRIINYGRVHVEGETSFALVGVGEDGVVINYGQVESRAVASGAVVAIGDGSRAINKGQVNVSGDFSVALAAAGEDAVALNLGRIYVDAAEASDGMGGISRDNTHLTNRGLVHLSADHSFAMLARVGQSLQVDNFGHIETDGTYAVGIGTGGNNVQIVNAGDIATQGELSLGITLGVTRIGFFPAAEGEIINRGVVETEGDGAAGIVMAGNGHHLTNSGRITTNGGAFEDDTVGLLRAAGVLVSGDEALVENTRSGIIESKDARSAAVELNVVERSGLLVADLSSHLDNFGIIKGADVAVLGGAGEETVINHGHISGDVVLGAGADKFVFGRGGILCGNLSLGSGDDFVCIENGAGRALIADFAAGLANGDVIDVSAFFSSFEGLKAHSHQQSNGVVVSLDPNDPVVLANVQLNELDAGDFLFT